jgi:hypothetical protein
MPSQRLYTVSGSVSTGKDGRSSFMKYKPEPIDTSSVSLPAELRTLTEQLAANAHDLWAAQRLAEGWSYGEFRDDHNKRHPCLVPYDELPDGEKEYDRITTIGTLKAILSLGYKIRHTH